MSEDSIQTLHAGRFLRLCQRDGWEYAERTNPQGAVVIVAVTPSDRVLLVEQYRIPIQSRTLEFPAGLVGDQSEFADESWRESAQRELLEETGWAAERIESIMSGPSSAGMTTEMMHFVRAIGLTQINSGGGDPSENIVVHEVPRTEVAAFVAGKMAAGYAIDPKVYAGIYFLARAADGTPVQV
jgi:ADP-ribose pyrophosphatase